MYYLIFCKIYKGKMVNLKMMKKKIIFIMALCMINLNFAGCGNKEDISSENSISSMQSIAENSEETTENPEYSVEETEKVTDEESKEDNSNTNTIGMTNRKFLRLVNDAFGFYSDESFENDVEVAKLWNIIDDDLEIDADTALTSEFLISVVMKATGYVEETSTIDEILDCAVQYKVIEKADISSVNVDDTEKIIESAKQAWLYPNMYK